MSGRLLGHRFRETEVIITGNNGNNIIIKPGCEGIQGDVTMPDIFCALYDETITEWMGWEKNVDMGLEFNLPS